MTINEVFKDMKKKKLIKNKKVYNTGVDWESALSVDPQRFMEETQAKKKKKKKIQPGIDWDSGVKIYNDLRDTM